MYPPSGKSVESVSQMMLEQLGHSDVSQAFPDNNDDLEDILIRLEENDLVLSQREDFLVKECVFF